jgi:glycosyltransferase involved in cell wall biosynthesis
MEPWPSRALTRRAGRIGVVTVNWNTRELVARQLFGIFRILAPDTVAEVVVVDNGSTDGSVEMLGYLAERHIIHFIANPRQRYHGPGVTQGVNRLAELACAGRAVDLVWVLDSDAFVLRADTIAVATAAMTRFAAVLAADLDDYRDAPAHVTTELLGACSTLFNPTAVWTAPHAPFLEDGEPSRQLQQDLVAAGHRILAFPFCRQGYVLHLGRATLDRVAELDARENRYREWAESRRAPHFGLRPDGPAIRATFERWYRDAVPDERLDTLANALAARR